MFTKGHIIKLNIRKSSFKNVINLDDDEFIDNNFAFSTKPFKLRKIKMRIKKAPLHL